jgi:hypothetical protein
MAIIEKKIFLVLEAGFAFETFVARQPVKDTSEVLEGFFAQGFSIFKDTHTVVV